MKHIETNPSDSIKLSNRIKRGQITPGFIQPYTDLPDEKLYKLLSSSLPQERTTAAYILGQRKKPESIPILCSAFQTTKTLYTRIEISNSLAKIGKIAVPALLELLGTIGSNQHKNLPAKNFEKKNYPLPRDIVARTIIRIGPPAIPGLLKVLQDGKRQQILEAIDAVGYISFYMKPNDPEIETELLVAYSKHIDDSLVRWKIVRAFQAFGTQKIQNLLEEIFEHDPFPAIRQEAIRSLKQNNRILSRKKEYKSE